MGSWIGGEGVWVILCWGVLRVLSRWILLHWVWGMDSWPSTLEGVRLHCSPKRHRSVAQSTWSSLGHCTRVGKCTHWVQYIFHVHRMSLQCRDTLQCCSHHLPMQRHSGRSQKASRIPDPYSRSNHLGMAGQHQWQRPFANTLLGDRMLHQRLVAPHEHFQTLTWGHWKR